jgi:hypothetical protein
MLERAWRLLALTVVGLVALAVNYDPVISNLPDLPTGGGVAVSETVKQAFVLAAVLTIVTALISLRAVLRPAASSTPLATGSTAVLPVTAAGAVAGVAIFLVLYGAKSDDRAAFAIGTLLVLGLAALAAFGAPSVATGSMSKLPIVATIGAVVLIAGYGAVLWFMFSNSGTKDATMWERMVTLFAGVESIGFAAVGALLGSQVQKTQTDAEHNRADANKAASDQRHSIATDLASAAQVMTSQSEALDSIHRGQLVGEVARLKKQLDELPKAR